MDNNFNTGKPHWDFIMLGLAWVGALINWSFVTGLFSIMASIFVIASKYQEMRDRKKIRNKK